MIEVVPIILVVVMVIIAAINIFTFIGVKQNMSYFADELLNVACADGKISTNVDTRYNQLRTSTGISPTRTWTTTYYNASQKTVQRGNTITLKLTTTARLSIFGTIGTNVTVTVTKSGVSEEYWR